MLVSEPEKRAGMGVNQSKTQEKRQRKKELEDEGREKLDIFAKTRSRKGLFTCEQCIFIGLFVRILALLPLKVLSKMFFDTIIIIPSLFCCLDIDFEFNLTQFTSNLEMYIEIFYIS